MNIAVVGSRNFKNLSLVQGFVSALPRHFVIISGGAKGVDSVASQSALENQMECKIFLPDFKYPGNSGYAIRNRQIVDESDVIVAFWSGKSKGTLMTINFAYNANKRVIIVDEKGKIS